MRYQAESDTHAANSCWQHHTRNNRGYSMKKWVKSFTYEPKIKAVLKGECTQTIRKYDPMTDGVQVGDIILFHGWEGKPRHSNWSWRKKIQVTEVLPMITDEEDFTIGKFLCRLSPEMEIIQECSVYRWDSQQGNLLAKLDHIDPPTGTALRDTLKELNPEDSYFQIIRWKPSIQCELSTVY